MEEIKVSVKLDLRNDVCPINFVKTKLKLEEMKEGEILEVILSDGEAVQNVPSSVKNEGHRIISMCKLDGAYSLLIKKCE